MRTRTAWFAGLVAGGLMCASAHAQPPAAGTARPATPSLASAVDAAWQRAISARAAEGERLRAEAERGAAQRPWAAPPSWAFSHRADRAGAQGRETEIGLAWPLWLPGQRAAQAAAAGAGSDRADAAAAAARLQLAGQVREAAWTLAEHAAAVAESTSQEQALKRLAEDVERRVRAGDLARADALAAQAEALAASAQRGEAAQRLLAARAQWTSLTGWKEPPQSSDLAETALPSAGAADAHPELRLAALSVEHARRRLDLVRASRRDPPELSVGWRRETAGSADPVQQSIVFGLRLPWGTEDRQRPQEAAALAELDLALTTHQRLRERLDVDRETARDNVESTRQQHEVEAERARLLRERAQLIDRSFRAGETPLPELLRAMAAAAQAEAGAARRQAALGLARARLQQAFGLLP